MLLRTRGMFWVSVALVAALVLAGCGGGGASDGGETNTGGGGGGQSAGTPSTSGDTAGAAQDARFIEASISDPQNLNPILSADTASSEIVALLFDGLYDLDDKADYVPRLAKGYSWSADNLQLTVQLRDDVKWHDGIPFTASDVVFTVNAIMHPGYTGYGQESYEPMVGAEAYLAKVAALNDDLAEELIDEATFNSRAEELHGEWMSNGAVSAPDDHTVVFKLAKVWAPAEIDFLLTVPVPEHLLKDALGAKMDDHEFSRNPVGTGRYVFGEWKPKEYVSVKANHDWYGGDVGIEEIIIKTVPDSNTLEIELETGASDFGGLSNFDRIADFEANPDLAVHEFQGWVYDYVGWNLKNPLFADKEIRQALAMAVNREAAVDAVLNGHGGVANTHGSPNRWDYNADVPVWHYDKARAEEIFASKGWVKGSDGILTKDGQRFSFELITNGGNKRREALALIVQNDLKEVGVEVKTDFIDFMVLLERVQNQAGQYDAMILGWQLSVSPHADTLFKTGGSQNDQFYSNPRVDELFDQAGQATDRADAKRLYGEIWKIVAEDQPYMFLAFQNRALVYNQRVKGPITDSPVTAGQFWNVQEWWLED